jgi:hypothetical protein
MLQLQLNPTVGVAPGTTTMTLGGLGDQPIDYSNCPNEPWQFVNPPVMTEGPPPGVSADTSPYPITTFWDPMSNARSSGNALGAHRWDPYNDWPSLKGLRGASSFDLSGARWSLVIVAGLAAFAVTFGVLYLRRKKS